MLHGVINESKFIYLSKLSHLHAQAAQELQVVAILCNSEKACNVYKSLEGKILHCFS